MKAEKQENASSSPMTYKNGAAKTFMPWTYENDRLTILDFVICWESQTKALSTRESISWVTDFENWGSVGSVLKTSFEIFSEWIEAPFLLVVLEGYLYLCVSSFWGIPLFTRVMYSTASILQIKTAIITYRLTNNETYKQPSIFSKQLLLNRLESQEYLHV